MRKNKGDVFMTAKELDIMVNAMRTKYHKIDSRLDITDKIWYLKEALYKIGTVALALELSKLYYEIEEIDTDEIVKLGTFKS